MFQRMERDNIYVTPFRYDDLSPSGELVDAPLLIYRPMMGESD